MHSINGYVYGNGPHVVLNAGQRVRWYLLGMGTEVDLHTPHWHGNTLTTPMGMRMDMIELLPGTMLVLTWSPTTRARGCSTATSTTTSSPA